MIIVVTCMDKNPVTGRETLVVSHGFDELTGRTVILPCEPPASIGAKFDPARGEFVLPAAE